MADPQYDNFWNKAAPGMLDMAGGLYTRNLANNEAASRLAAARGPLYNQQVAGASGMLTQAGNFDPNAFAADRFKEQQALLNPLYSTQENALMASLRAKGQLGLSSYAAAGVDPVTKTTQSWAPGTAVNPQLAAFYAARNAQQSKDAYGSMDQGQQYIDNLVKRSGLLSNAAANTQTSGIQGQNTQPSRAAGVAELLKGAGGVLKDTGVLKDIVRGAPGFIGSIPGMFGNGLSWLNQKMFGAPDTSMIGDFGGFDGADYSTSFT